MKAYWFSIGGKARQGTQPTYEVRPEPYKEEGEIIPCENGLHASVHPFDALQFVGKGTTLDLVELGGTIVAGGAIADKYAASERTHLKRIDAGPLCHEFARWCALQVVDNWDCPPVVRQWLETGDPTLTPAAQALSERGEGAAANGLPAYYASQAAYYAAYSAAPFTKLAAYMAARGIEYSGLARGMARPEILAAQRLKFQEFVDQAFNEVQV